MSYVEEVREAVRAVNGPPGSQSLDDSSLPPLLHQLARYWWVELLLGVFWVVMAIVVLKSNHASVVTVGVLTGIMFLVFAAEEVLLAVLDKGASRWGMGAVRGAAGRLRNRCPDPSGGDLRRVR